MRNWKRVSSSETIQSNKGEDISVKHGKACSLHRCVSTIAASAYEDRLEEISKLENEAKHLGGLPKLYRGLITVERREQYLRRYINEIRTRQRPVAPKQVQAVAQDPEDVQVEEQDIEENAVMEHVQKQHSSPPQVEDLAAVVRDEVPAQAPSQEHVAVEESIEESSSPKSLSLPEAVEQESPLNSPPVAENIQEQDFKPVFSPVQIPEAALCGPSVKPKKRVHFEENPFTGDIIEHVQVIPSREQLQNVAPAEQDKPLTEQRSVENALEEVTIDLPPPVKPEEAAPFERQETLVAPQPVENRDLFMDDVTEFCTDALEVVPYPDHYVACSSSQGDHATEMEDLRRTILDEHFQFADFNCGTESMEDVQVEENKQLDQASGVVDSHDQTMSDYDYVTALQEDQALPVVDPDLVSNMDGVVTENTYSEEQDMEDVVPPMEESADDLSMYEDCSLDQPDAEEQRGSQPKICPEMAQALREQIRAYASSLTAQTESLPKDHEMTEDDIARDTDMSELDDTMFEWCESQFELDQSMSGPEGLDEYLLDPIDRDMQDSFGLTPEEQDEVLDPGFGQGYHWISSPFFHTSSPFSDVPKKASTNMQGVSAYRGKKKMAELPRYDHGYNQWKEYARTNKSSLENSWSYDGGNFAPRTIPTAETLAIDPQPFGTTFQTPSHTRCPMPKQPYQPQVPAGFPGFAAWLHRHEQSNEAAEKENTGTAASETQEGPSSGPTGVKRGSEDPQDSPNKRPHQEAQETTTEQPSTVETSSADPSEPAPVAGSKRRGDASLDESTRKRAHKDPDETTTEQSGSQEENPSARFVPAFVFAGGSTPVQGAQVEFEFSGFSAHMEPETQEDESEDKQSKIRFIKKMSEHRRDDGV